MGLISVASFATALFVAALWLIFANWPDTTTAFDEHAGWAFTVAVLVGIPMLASHVLLGRAWNRVLTIGTGLVFAAAAVWILCALAFG